MKLNKKQAFFALSAAVIMLCLFYQAFWIFSRTTMTEFQGEVIYHARRHATLNLISASYSVENRTYDGLYLEDGAVGKNHFFEIRYLIFAPGISRSNTFASNWGTLIMVWAVLMIFFGILFIRKDIIADAAVFVLQSRRPFIRIGHNQIEDYEQHDVEHQPLSKEQEALRMRLKAEQKPLAAYEIKASVYKYNPNAIGILVVYLLYFLWVFHLLFFGHIGSGEACVHGAILLFIPLYIQNTNNRTFRMRILDDEKLAFLTDGLQYEETFYSIEQIEAAVVYLEAFHGFAYRDRTTVGKIRATASGDNNKISFRFNGEVIDLTFYLANYADYFDFLNLMAIWSSKGVNVLLQKVFEDEFVLQETVHFGASDS